MGHHHNRTAGAIIIGGGIIGTSIAWNLARMGASDVVLLERATIAAGASGRTGALLRRHYTNQPEALLAQLGWQTYRDWPEIVGGDCGFVPHGLVVTLDTGPGYEQNAERLRRNVDMQRSLGINTDLLTSQQLKELQPFGCFDDLSLAAFEPESGYVDAIASTRLMAQAASRAGAKIFEGEAARKIETHDSKVSGVTTDNGTISAPIVVCAAGPWSIRLLSKIGVQVPITSLRVQIAIVQRPLELLENHFVYVDTAAGMFCRPWSSGCTLIGVGGGDQHDEVDPDRFEQRNDLDYPGRAIRAAARRLPAMAQATYLHGHAGLYDMTPDAHPVIGSAGPEGLYIAAGFSGAGFKKGPSVGQCLAELILERETPAVDLTPFRLGRFHDETWRRPWSETEYDLSSDFGHKI